MGWLNLPVTTGTGPIPPAGGTDGSGNQASPTDWSSWEFKNQFYDALEVKSQEALNNCNAEFPPPDTYYAVGPLGGVTVNSSSGTKTLVFSFTNVDWHVSSPFSGERWAGYSGGECFNYLPSQYDLIAVSDHADPYTWIRLPITANTFDSNTSTGTITTTYQPAANAVTANFIPSISALGSGTYRIVRQASGLTSRDRRPLKPNQRELWRGQVGSGWIDSSGNGHIQEISNSIDPSPYDTDGGPLPLNNWKTDQWHTREVLFFDTTGLLQRLPVNGNNLNSIGFNQSIYKVTVTASSGNFSLGASSNTSSSAITQPFDATASQIQTAFAATNGPGGATVSGSGPFTITFPASDGFVSLSATGANISAPDGAQNLSSGAFIICHTGDKGMPGRIPEPQLSWNLGVKQAYQTHKPDDSIGQVGKPAYSIDWPEGSPCGGGDCINVSHITLDADAMYGIDSECVPGSAGLHLAPDLFKTWRGLQLGAIGLLSAFVDKYNPFGDFSGPSGPNYFSLASWAVGAGQPGAWSATLGVSSSVGNVGTPPFTPTSYPLSVDWTLKDEHARYIASGTATINAMGVISGSWDESDDGLTILLYAGLPRFYRRRHKYNYSKGQWIADCGINPTTGLPSCNNPPAITPGGMLANPAAPTLTLGQGGTLDYNVTKTYAVTALNASGETLPSSEVSVSTVYTTGTPPAVTTITTNTYSVKVNWTPELGSSSYSIYRDDGSGLKYMANVSAYDGTWTDDGSITPAEAAPTSNTTSTDCFGTGYFVFRDISQSHLSVTADGIVLDGGSNLSTGVLSRYMGDTAHDPFSGRGPVLNALDDASYWDRLFRGHHHKALQQTLYTHQSGTVVAGTKYSIFDPTANWWTDGINSGTMRVQGGLLTAGGSTTVADSDYNNLATSKSCWFNSQAFTGSLGGVVATPYSFFILEVYAGGKPAGWTIAVDGSATYSAPSASGTSGTITAGTAPTISGVTPTPLHSTGLQQKIFVQGNNFHPDCTVSLTDPSSNTIAAFPSVTPGELTIAAVVFPRDASGSWSITVTNPSGGASSAFNFTVHQVQAVPVQSFAAGVFTLSATLDAPAATNDCYLIRWPKYEINRHRGRVVQITPTTGDAYQLVCRYSDNTGLYFDPQSQALTGSYQILEIDTGATLQLSTSKPTVASKLAWSEAPPDGTSKRYWVQPTGDDSRGEKFLPGINYNLETKVADYGLWTLLDDFGAHIPNTLYELIRAMTTTTTGVGWHNYDQSLTPENNYNGREAGAQDDLTFGEAAPLWSQICPVSNMGTSPCNPGSTEIHSDYLDCGKLDGTAPFADATAGNSSGYAGPAGCGGWDGYCEGGLPPDENCMVSGAWIYAYAWITNLMTCYSCNAKVYCYSPPIPDATGETAAPCTCYFHEADGTCVGDCDSDSDPSSEFCDPVRVPYDIIGKRLWAGGSVGLSYDGWAEVGAASGTNTNRSTGKIGSEPVPIDPSITTGSSKYFDTISTSYSISESVALLEWEDDYG